MLRLPLRLRSAPLRLADTSSLATEEEWRQWGEDWSDATYHGENQMTAKIESDTCAERKATSWRHFGSKEKTETLAPWGRHFFIGNIDKKYRPDGAWQNCLPLRYQNIASLRLKRSKCAVGEKTDYSED